MRPPRWMRERARATISIAVVVLVVVGVGVAAVLWQGVSRTTLALNDGGVWVTNPSSLLVGRLNAQSRTLDSSLATADARYDIAQAGESVLVDDQGAATLAQVDPASITLGQSIPLPQNAEVVLGGATVAVLDPAKGALWVTTMGQLGAFHGKDSPVTAKVGAGAAVTVDGSGTVFAVAPMTGRLLTVAVSDGVIGKPSTSQLSGVHLHDSMHITAVGDQAVVLDKTTKTLLVPASGTSVHLADAGSAVLQQPGPTNDAVLVATNRRLVVQPLDGGSATSMSASGSPVAPVYSQGCAYAVWNSSNRYVRRCTAASDDQSLTVPGASGDAQLVFRVNRGVVVLNDTRSGAAWLVQHGMTRVDNWDQVAPANVDRNDQKKQQQSASTLTATQVQRSAVNHPPLAVDETFGVRAGRATVLPVTAQDSDPDGDVLTASTTATSTSIGAVSESGGGAALQIDVPPAASGSVSFPYTVSDGRGGTASATVHVSVHPPSQEAPPQQLQIPSVVVDEGATVNYEVLPSWMDPDGDTLFLQSAAVSTADRVRWTPDGTVTFSAIGNVLGEHMISLVVSDGQKSSVGQLIVDVQAAGSAKPVANPDFATAQAGQTITVSPLGNDIDPSGAALSLAHVDTAANATIAVDQTAGTFTFTSRQPGTYLLNYTASDGPNTAQSFVRVDVAPATNEAPIAVPDTAYLPKNGHTLVDVLANDIDPAGNVLVVQSVNVPANSGVTVEVLQHSQLRIYDQAGITSEVSLQYTVSDGHASATADVLVVPIPAPTQLIPPVAVADTAKVRVGDVVTIPVLDNDYSPTGDQLTLQKLVAPLPPASAGTIFVSQNTVRFKAGSAPGTVNATYEVEDAHGETAAGYITIQVVPDSTNSAPVPQPVTARAIAGTSVRIPIQLNGIDPDGDSVTLLGVGSAPTLGKVTTVGTSWLVYDAAAGAGGTDRFTYVVQDTFGAQATGSVTVGIAPRAGTDHPPVAVPDHVEVRPSRDVAIDVLATDSDPDGDPLTLLGKLVVPHGIKARVSDQKIVVMTSSSPGTYAIQYRVSDGRGGTASGVLTVTVSRTAPLLPPVANDDVLAVAQIAGKSSVTVDVLGNDSDPNGVTDDLKVSAAGQKVRSDGRVTVKVAAKRQVIEYTDKDPDGLKSSAFIIVPGTDEAVPALRAGVSPVRVKSGATVDIPLSKYIVSAAGGSIQTVPGTAASAGHAASAPDPHGTTVTYHSLAGYIGPDTVTVTVSAGGKSVKAVVGIPVQVLPSSAVPPVFTASTVNVSPGEDAVTFDLSSATTDADPSALAHLSYALDGGVASGFTASVAGHTLTVAAGASTAKGTTAALHITVSNGATKTDGVVTALVVASSRPLPVANPDSVVAKQGQTSSVPVLDNDFNPFPNTPLRVVSATVAGGSGSASVSGSNVNVTPASSFVGVMTVQYRIEDATGDPSREVNGLITATVLGKPAAPGIPTVSGVGDRTLVLSWAPGSDNGSPITGYTVRSQNGFSQDCPAATCTLTGLTNNTSYTFTVVARNAVGDSPASPASAPARPDVKPNAVAAPTVTASTSASGTLNVSWSAPVVPDGGSAVASYAVTISPPPSSGVAVVNVAAPGTSTSFSGLANGTTYSVTVTATNGGGTSDPSPAGSGVPAGAPAAPGVSAAGQATTVVFTIAPPASNGRPIAQLDYRVDGGATQSMSAGGGQVSAGNGYAQTHSITAWAVDSDGRVGAQASASGSTSNPVPTVNVSEGAQDTSNSGCQTTACHDFNVSLSGGRANTTYTIDTYTNCAAPGRTGSYACSGEQTLSPWGTFTATTDGNGNWSSASARQYTYGFPGDTLTVHAYLDGALVSQSSITWY